jgi:hypothetical protein
MPHSPGIGAIFGIVSENGIAKAGGRVGLYDRSTMQLVYRTTADALGGYRFTGLNQNTSDYLVVALDDDGSPAKNALVQDYIQPISAHMGAAAPMNWHYLAATKKPVAIFEPVYVYDRFRPPHGSRGASLLTGAALFNQASITAGAPQYPSLKLNNGFVSTVVRMRDGTQTQRTADPIKESLEWSTDTSLSGACCGERWWCWSTYNGYYANRPAILLDWNRTTKVLSWLISYADVSDGGTLFNAVGSNVASNSFDSYTASGLSDGPHHFVVATEYGKEAKLYIDGALVKTTSLIGKPTTHATPGNFNINLKMKFGGYGGTTEMGYGYAYHGPSAWYPATLSDADVLAHYNALMVGSTPLLTGYTRDVLTDSPQIYVRLNATTYGNETDFLNYQTMNHTGTITVLQTSPVVGGSMYLFGGGAMRCEGLGAGLAPLGATFEFWIRPTSATPAATGYIAAGRWNSDDTTFNWYVQQLITTGKISVTVRRSTDANETITFNYSPPTDADKLIAIVLDKITPTAKLYVNGALQDTQTLAPGYFYAIPEVVNYADSITYSRSSFMLGGLVSDANAASSPYYGKLGEFVVYPEALTADRLLSHYTSRDLT